MRTLLIDNDIDRGESLRRALTGDGFSVDWVRDAQAGQLAFNGAYYALVLIAVGLPGVGGIEVLKTIRSRGETVPVMTLAEPTDDACVRSLDNGADDCLHSALEMVEVLARIRAVLRRRAGHATSRIGSDALSLDLDTRTLCFMGTAAPLSVREFALMHALLERPGLLLSRAQLEDRLYGWGKEVESNALDVLIHQIRKRFGRSAIVNVRGGGWMSGGASPDSSGVSDRRTRAPASKRADREARPTAAMLHAKTGSLAIERAAKWVTV
ncbi:response regulator transcription factor [Burkholderia dolosa]|uniref:Response regulator transcription factor n=2 Tax=Burkholderia dolosa TaxID=152500 RepID=A0A892ICP6_9BURK|nr:response regulator [Burkholderia dolosa AU0158]AYZ94047.1 DNA-binding response regulator [Burkholderia dolosa]ETP62217.1 XRE family transcriptional regulator [Burkholderia dolosa PC543]PRE42636.1 DNA-binding response regulator [Burkholderia sp. AU12872]PUA77306.1 DNA-binding response regulator [Burkholderia sp. AU29985]